MEKKLKVVTRNSIDGVYRLRPILLYKYTKKETDFSTMLWLYLNDSLYL